MSNSLPPVPGARHLSRLEKVRPAMAKVDLNPVEKPWREQVGRAVVRAFALAGVSQKEAAALLDRDTGQVARWCSGAERPSIDLIFAVATLRQPLVQALGELAGADVQTTIILRRLA